MKILLINNNTRHLTDLEKALTAYDVEMRNYHPGLDFSCTDKDLVILSGGGGEGLEIDDEHKPGELWYRHEMEFIKTTDKPVLGVCMGFEIISRSYGAKVKKMSKGLERFVKIQTTADGQKLFGLKTLRQFEGHDWHVTEAPTDFKVLAESATGIEIIKHKNRKILGVQFHPEKGGTLDLGSVIKLHVI